MSIRLPLPKATPLGKVDEIVRRYFIETDLLKERYFMGFDDSITRNIRRQLLRNLMEDYGLI
jgi:hypothetical protein